MITDKHRRALAAAIAPFVMDAAQRGQATITVEPDSVSLLGLRPDAPAAARAQVVIAVSPEVQAAPDVARDDRLTDAAAHIIPDEAVRRLLTDRSWRGLQARWRPES